MAGGMSRGGGLPLGERRRAGSNEADETRQRHPRHCWVEDAPGQLGRFPGVLLEWRRAAGGWEGRVVYAMPDEPAPRLVERWLPAAYLTGADAPS